MGVEGPMTGEKLRIFFRKYNGNGKLSAQCQ